MDGTIYRSGMILSEAPGPLPPLDEPHAYHFYHVMNLPCGTVTSGQWDLRGKVDEYLGGVDFTGKRVLEIGPASGFLTAEMDARGADVIAVEVPDEPGWDFVPYPDAVLKPLHPHRQFAMNAMKRSFWYVHRALGLRAQVLYHDACKLPPWIGRFDVGVLASVLLHTASPHLVMASVAKLTDKIVITEMLHPDMELKVPFMRLVPTAENREWGVWWHFSTTFFQEYLGVLGFRRQKLTYHDQLMTSQGRTGRHFTIVAQR